MLIIFNFQLDGSLADLVLELGYSFCNTVEECRNNLANFGVGSITPAAVAKVLGVMVRTHTGLPSEQVRDHKHMYSWLPVFQGANFIELASSPTRQLHIRHTVVKQTLISLQLCTLSM